MADVIPFPRRNIQEAPTEELKRLWDVWSGDPAERLGDFDFEAVHWELNRRGEGRHCAV